MLWDLMGIPWNTMDLIRPAGRVRALLSLQSGYLSVYLIESSLTLPDLILSYLSIPISLSLPLCPVVLRIQAHRCISQSCRFHFYTTWNGFNMEPEKYKDGPQYPQLANKP